MVRKLLLPLLLGFVLASCQGERSAGHDATLDAFFELLGNEYYDPDFAGLDIERLEEKARGEARDVDTEAELYARVLRPTLAHLDASHTGAWTDAEYSGVEGVTDSPLVEADALACLGLVIQNVRTGIAPRVVEDLRSDDSFGPSGSMIGWRLQSWGPAGDAQLETSWIDTEGEERQITAPSDPARTGIDDTALRDRDGSQVISLETLDEAARAKLANLQAGHVDPAQRIFYRPLGLVLTAGRAGNMPRIIEVAPDRQQVAGKVEPGDNLMGLSVTRDGAITRAKLKLMRAGALSDITLSRECDDETFIRKPRITVTGDIAFVQFDEFTAETADALRRQAAGISARHVIFDLRRNLGGDVSALKDIAGLFFGPDLLIGFDNTRGSKNEVRTTGRAVASFSGSAAILTSPVTGSSAEVFAYFAKARSGGIVAGERSSGNVLVAKLFQLPGGGLVQIPVRAFATFDGVSLEQRGLTPDTSIPADCSIATPESCADLFASGGSRPDQNGWSL